MPNTHYSIDGLLGAHLEETQTAPEHGLGTVTTSNKGLRWIYVSTAGAHAAATVMAVNNTTLAATAATAGAGERAAYVVTPMVAGNYGWVVLGTAAVPL